MLGTLGVREANSHTSTPLLPEEERRAHFAVVPGLPGLLEHAVPVTGVEKARNAHDQQNPTIVGFQEFAAAASVDGRLYKVKLVVRHDRDGRRHYDHRLSYFTDIGEAPSEPPSRGEGTAAVQGGDPLGTFINVSLLKALFNGGALAKAQSIPAGAR